MKAVTTCSHLGSLHVKFDLNQPNKVNMTAVLTEHCISIQAGLTVVTCWIEALEVSEVVILTRWLIFIQVIVVLVIDAGAFTGVIAASSRTLPSEL